MFELGLRLAFDKPTVIVKDDKTDYTFDTGIIEHVPYPRDLRFNRIVTFKTALADKVLNSYKAAKGDPDHSTFLKNFGKFHVATLTQDVIPADKLVVEMLSDLQVEVARIRRGMPRENDKKTREDRVEGAARIGAEIARYLAINPTANLADLISNKEFVSDMEKQCSAPTFFSSRTDFERVLERTLAEIGAQRRSG